MSAEEKNKILEEKKANLRECEETYIQLQNKIKQLRIEIGELEAELEKNENNETKPDFNVKFGEEYVGAGWINDGKFGKYITVRINQKVTGKISIFPKKGSDIAIKADASNVPALTVKVNGEKVGNAWINEGEYGKYITASLVVSLQEGSTVHLYPKKGISVF